MNQQIMLARCQVLVVAMFGKELSESWWDSRNKAFDMKTPNEVWTSEPDRVYAYLMGWAGR